jgi:serine/threonine-protein kinase
MGVRAGIGLGSNIVLERQIGAGAMGAVWLAQNRALGSAVAVKVLKAGLALDAQALARFQAEARAASSIDSPHVVKVFDFGVTPDNEPYIVMELLRGRDLGEVLEKDGPMSPHRTALVVGQLCRALARAHELNVIHRDIKPANVFLLESDGEPFVKVLDFGIARFAGDGNMAMTSTGAVVGTPYYMSPEQFFEPRSIDRRSDLWSVAVVAYSCLLGRLPFLGDSIGTISLAVHRATFALPSQIDPRLPRALDAFFQRALSTSRDARYGSAQELAAAFNAAVGLAGTASGSVAAPPAGSPAFAATALAPPNLTVGSPAAPIVPTSFSQPSLAGMPPAAATKPASPWPWIVLASFILASGVVGAAFILSRTSDDRSRAAADADSESSDEEDERPKKKKKTKKTDEPETPADEPETPSAQPPPAPPEAKTADPKETATAKPAAAPATPSAPKPPPQTFLYTGTACWAYSNKTCPTVADCCPGSGPRDVTQWAPPRAGKDRAECRCMRPKCGPGENWSTHKCKM